MKCLFTLHKKAIRLIRNADRLAHTNAMFEDISILKLSDFVKYKTAIVMFNSFHGILSIQLQKRFTKYSSVHSQWRIVGARGPGARNSVGLSAISRVLPKVSQLGWRCNVGAGPRRQSILATIY